MNRRAVPPRQGSTRPLAGQVPRPERRRRAGAAVGPARRVRAAAAVASRRRARSRLGVRIPAPQRRTGPGVRAGGVGAGVPPGPRAPVPRRSGGCDLRRPVAARRRRRPGRGGRRRGLIGRSADADAAPGAARGTRRGPVPPRRLSAGHGRSPRRSTATPRRSTTGLGHFFWLIDQKVDLDATAIAENSIAENSDAFRDWRRPSGRGSRGCRRHRRRRRSSVPDGRGFGLGCLDHASCVGLGGRGLVAREASFLGVGVGDRVSCRGGGRLWSSRPRACRSGGSPRLPWRAGVRGRRGSRGWPCPR